MKYINAAEILPEQLLKELQAYIDGRVLYIPKASVKKEWGATSGARAFYRERNREIQKLLCLCNCTCFWPPVLGPVIMYLPAK